MRWRGLTYRANLLRCLGMARNDSLQGTLPLLVLTILERRGPLHGYGITEHIVGLSDALRVEEGSLYPALHRMEEAGWIKARWVVTDRNRRARQYTTSPSPDAASSTSKRADGVRSRQRSAMC